MECKRYSNPFNIVQILTARSIVLLDYREDGVTPYIIVLKHGLDEMKV